MNDQQITAQVLPNEELISKLCTMYSLYPLEKMTTVLWKEAVSRLESNDSRIAALEAQNARLVEALKYFAASNDRSGEPDGEWQTYAMNRWGKTWNVLQMEDAEIEARALLAEVTK